MGKQARGRGLDDEGSEEEEADGQRRTQSEAVCDPKDSGAYQARNKVQERDSNGKDGRDWPVKAKDRWLGQSQDLAWHAEAKAEMLKGYPGKVGKGWTMARTSNREDPNKPEEHQPDSLKKALRLPW
ncbi:hypothetical protein PAXRUDRAFT_21756 [Paxillus rubicundulus Ve08.2h10]|uniref:Uncharacterized protein n=1 Tax=Paxillus rubicundulus Ve08.2h10 TaxID=930991 RepID=A0A0D0CP97_9AGAM|nr:hypothetical protein PAXRUDRAFT_21756 [Paxillus rubicundulus Ve08.2h10]